MRHNYIKLLIIGCAAIGASHKALAEDFELATPKSAWSTSSHLGYAVEDRSSTGFAQVGGSLVFLDITHPISSSLDLGLRSTAQGAHSALSQFYRLGAGPMATYKINKDWAVQGAFNLFNETGLGDKSQTTYMSHGEEIQLGWERVWTFGRRVQVAGGSFATFHQGGVTTPTALTNSRYATQSHPTANSGVSHGLEMALRLSL